MRGVGVGVGVGKEDVSACWPKTCTVVGEADGGVVRALLPLRPIGDGGEDVVLWGRSEEEVQRKEGEGTEET